MAHGAQGDALPQITRTVETGKAVLARDWLTT